MNDVSLKKSDEEYTGLLDAAHKIVRDEGGISALYAGCVQDVGKTIIDSFLFFLAYNYIRTKRLDRRDGAKRLPIGEELGVGMLAGAVARLFTTPVSNIVTRKQTAAMMGGKGRNRTVSEIASTIKREKGILGFWSGYSATLVLTLNPALTFLFHETLLRAVVKREHRESPGSRKTFIIAALSKAMASMITYPFSLAKARSQISSKQPLATDVDQLSGKDSIDNASRKVAAKAKQQTIFNVIIDIVREEGFWALYSGLEGDLLKGFFSHGLTMLLKERIYSTVVQTYYFILKLLQKFSSPQELAESAVQTAKDTAADVSEKAQDVANSVSESATNLSARAQEVVKSVSETAPVKSVYETASSLGERAQDTAKAANESASNLGQRAQGVVASVTGSEPAKSAYETASNLGQRAQDAAQTASSAAVGISEKAQEVVTSIPSEARSKAERAIETANGLYKKGVESSTDLFDEYIKTDDN